MNWNGKEDTVKCIDSLHKVTYPDFTILISDNASTDGSVDLLKHRYPDIEVIVNEKNLGFAGGNNTAIRRALQNGSDYVLLLNNDTEVDPRFLSELVKAAEADPAIGIAGSKIY